MEASGNRDTWWSRRCPSILRRSAAHLFAQAALTLPRLHLGGPAIEDGFYDADNEAGQKFLEDLPRIEKEEMKKIVKENFPSIREWLKTRQWNLQKWPYKWNWLKNTQKTQWFDNLPSRWIRWPLPWPTCHQLVVSKIFHLLNVAGACSVEIAIMLWCSMYLWYSLVR